MFNHIREVMRDDWNFDFNSESDMKAFRLSFDKIIIRGNDRNDIYTVADTALVNFFYDFSFAIHNMKLYVCKCKYCGKVFLGKKNAVACGAENCQATYQREVKNAKRRKRENSTCKEVEAVQAVIIKSFQYLTEHRASAVDSSDKLICELFIVKKIAPELRYVSEHIIKAYNGVCVLGDFSPYALVILGNNKYHAFCLLVDAIEQDFFIFAHITLLFYNVQDRIRYDNYTIAPRKSQDNNV